VEGGARSSADQSQALTGGTMSRMFVELRCPGAVRRREQGAARPLEELCKKIGLILSEEE